MSIHDSTAEVLYHAALNLVRKSSSIRSAIATATRDLYWTDDVKVWRPFHEAYHMYQLLNGHNGDAWPIHTNFRGGAWLDPVYKSEQLLSMLFTYEYLVQELGASRAPLDLETSTIHDQSGVHPDQFAL